MKKFIKNAITTNPSRYAIDQGDLHLINDYFQMMGWELITREQHTAIAGIIRGRTKFLTDSPFDMREIYKPKPKRDLNIYDLIGDEVIETFGSKIAMSTKTILKHFERYPQHQTLPNAVLMKKVQADTIHDSITLSKFIFKLAYKLNFKPKALDA